MEPTTPPARKPGQKKKDATKKKVGCCLTLTPAEKNKLEALAGVLDLTPSEYVVRRLKLK